MDGKKSKTTKANYTIKKAMDIFVEYVDMLNHLPDLVKQSGITQQSISRSLGKSYVSLWRKLKSKKIHAAEVHKLLLAIRNMQKREETPDKE